MMARQTTLIRLWRYIFLAQIIALFTALMPAAVFSQDGDAGDAGAFLKHGFGVKGALFGEAFTAIASDPSAVYYNPAGIGFSEKAAAEIGFNRPFANADGLNYYNVAATFPVSFGRFGIGLAALSVTDIPVANDVSGPTGETFDDTELGFFFSFANSLSENVSFGASLKAISQKLYDYSTSGYGLDIAVLYKAAGKFNMGLILRDVVGPKLKLNQRAYQMPFKLTFASSYKLFDRFTSALGMQATNDRKMTLQPAIDFELLANTLFIRESYSTRTKAFKLGFSLHISGFYVDYFYSLNDDLGDANSVGLRWKAK